MITILATAPPPEENLELALMVFAIGLVATIVTFATVWISHRKSAVESPYAEGKSND